MKDKYEDILNYKYEGSETHPKMSLESRSAQFASFAALSGYEDLVMETSRLTNNKINLNDEQKELINNKINLLNKEIKKQPIITIKHFVNDSKKQGGEYITTTGNLRRIDFIEGFLELKDKKKILFNDILEIKSDDVNLDYC